MKKMKKKAQLEVMQSAFAMMFVFFILVIAAIFLIAQQKQQTKNKIDQFLILSQMKKSMSVALLPEVQYSSDNVLVTDNYDRYALFSFKNIIEDNKLYYSQMFQNVKLRVGEFNYKSGWKEYEIFDYSPTKFTTKNEFKIPVTLTDAASNEKTIGVIYLEIYK